MCCFKVYRVSEKPIKDLSKAPGWYGLVAMGHDASLMVAPGFNPRVQH